MIPVNWQHLFYPESIAVIGASNAKGSWGANIMSGLRFAGGRRIYPVNPKATEVSGIKAYPDITAVPETVDLAVIVVSAPLVPGVLSECAAMGIRTAVVITAGFGETGEEGQKLEAELVRIASESGLRFIGPNSMGHANTRSRLTTFGQGGEIPPGSVAVLSQIGSMTLAIVRRAVASGVTVGKYVSTGNEASIHLEDYLEHLAEDDETSLIIAYIEGLREGRRFFRLARDITLKKPIVVMKIGGTEESARAVRSHTGALAGSDSVYNAAFRQAGVIRAADDEELTDIVFALQNCALPRNNRVGILSIGGGPGAIAAEACEKEGLRISRISRETVEKLDKILPPRWSRRNPVDMAGISAAEYPLIVSSLSALMEDENVDAVFLQAPMVASKEHLAVRGGLSPGEIQAYQEKEKANLSRISEKVAATGKPVFFLGVGSWSGPGISGLFHNEKVIVIPNAHRAARVMRHLTWYGQYLKASGVERRPVVPG